MIHMPMSDPVWGSSVSHNLAYEIFMAHQDALDHGKHNQSGTVRTGSYVYSSVNIHINPFFELKPINNKLSIGSQRISTVHHNAKASTKRRIQNSRGLK